MLRVKGLIDCVIMLHIYMLQDINTTFDIIQMTLSRNVRPVVGTMMKFHLQHYLVQMSENI